jgi:transposase-like protein
MSEVGILSGVRRRSREEALSLVAAYEVSGLSRRDFCAQHGLGVPTLDLYRRWARQSAAGARLLAVDVRAALRPAASTAPASAGLTVVLRNGRRIEVGGSFDPGLLTELIGLLERA